MLQKAARLAIRSIEFGFPAVLPQICQRIGHRELSRLRSCRVSGELRVLLPSRVPVLAQLGHLHVGRDHLVVCVSVPERESSRLTRLR